LIGLFFFSLMYSMTVAGEGTTLLRRNGTLSAGGSLAAMLAGFALSVAFPAAAVWFSIRRRPSAARDAGAEPADRTMLIIGASVVVMNIAALLLTIVVVALAAVRWGPATAFMLLLLTPLFSYAVGSRIYARLTAHWADRGCAARSSHGARPPS